jgi:hypothetical protein
MLWRALSAIEELQTAWEEKAEDPEFKLYKEALNNGIEKLRKYYNRFDNRPLFVLSQGKVLLFIHIFVIS